MVRVNPTELSDKGKEAAAADGEAVQAAPPPSAGCAPVADVGRWHRAHGLWGLPATTEHALVGAGKL